MNKILASLAMLVAFAVAAQTQHAPQSGTYFIWESEEPGLAGLSVFIEGEAARTLYDTMTVAPIKNECSGGLTKEENGFECTLLDGSYACSVGIDVRQGTIGAAQSC